MTKKHIGDEIKVVICDPVPRDTRPDYYQWKIDYLKTVARPEVKIDYVCLPAGKGYFDVPTTPYQHAVNSPAIAEQAYIAEKRGYDAFILGGVCDYKNEIRALVDIPVIHPMESAYYLASMMGDKFSIICDAHHWFSKFEAQMQLWGIQNKCGSMRHPAKLDAFDDSWEWMKPERHAEFTAIIREEMAKAVKEDRAEALIMGFTVAGTVLAMQGLHEVDGAPVIDPMTAAIKMAEIMVDLQRTTDLKVCRNSIYEGPTNGWEKVHPIHY